MKTVRMWAGWLVMTAGALGVLFGAGLGVFLTANFVEWRNVGPQLGSIWMIAGPIALVGVVVAIFGRWLHGGWSSERPLRRVMPWVLALGGAVAAVAYLSMLAHVLLVGFGPEDYAGAAKLAVAGGLGLASMWASGRVRGEG